MRVLIVDDESETSEGLRDFLPWDELGVNDVRISTDGAEALALCREIEPDIIISDIRMPRMDGITFAENVRSILPGAKLILMSAYTDKRYFKSALELKAVNFVEKPINVGEMTSALRSACDMNRREKNVLSLLRGTGEYAQKLAGRLTRPPTDTLKILQDIEEINPAFLTINRYCTIIIKAKPRAAAEEIEDEVIRDALGAVFSAYLMTRFENHEAMAHVCDKALSSEASARRLFQRTAELINRGLNVEDGVFMSVGISVTGIENIWCSYKSTSEPLSSFFFTGYGVISFYNGKNAAPTPLKGEYVPAFENNLRANDKAGAMETLAEMVQEVRQSRHLDPDSVRNTCFNLALCILAVAKERNLPEVKAESRDFVWKSVAEQETFLEIYRTLCDKTDSFFSALEYASIRKPVCRVIMYIEQNYAKKSLTINEIAENIHLTPAHVCHLFKKEMGITVNQYLNNYRVDKAKHLLKTHSLKLSAVAAQVGYSDANYFMRIFKKITGATPSEYRDKYLFQ